MLGVTHDSFVLSGKNPSKPSITFISLVSLENLSGSTRSSGFILSPTAGKYFVFLLSFCVLLSISRYRVFRVSNRSLIKSSCAITGKLRGEPTKPVFFNDFCTSLTYWNTSVKTWVCSLVYSIPLAVQRSCAIHSHSDTSKLAKYLGSFCLLICSVIEPLEWA